VVFDGTNIWVANSGDDSVWELQASDGVVLATFTGFEQPEALAFDGTNIWIANSPNVVVTRLRPSDGTRHDYTVGSYPFDLLFDGSKMWVTCIYSDSLVAIGR